MYLERLKSVRSTERGLHLTFSSGDTEESIELSPEAVEQTLEDTSPCNERDAGEGPLTFTVLGHQVVRTHEAYGLLLRTQEFGDVVFSLPPAILKRLIGDLMHWHPRHLRRKHFRGRDPPRTRRHELSPHLIGFTERGQPPQAHFGLRTRLTDQ